MWRIYRKCVCVFGDDWDWLTEKNGAEEEEFSAKKWAAKFVER